MTTKESKTWRVKASDVMGDMPFRPRQPEDFHTHRGCPRCGGTGIIWHGMGKTDYLRCQFYGPNAGRNT
jgi:hypothetical protein